MTVDLKRGGPERLQADAAVIGAGAAGLTIARRLVDGGLTVVLLESGGFDYEPDSADLNRGEIVGEPYYPLHDARLRFFGGTTAIWGGRSAELDPIDFERRDWVPWSGWPFSHADLQPWYRQAWRLLDLPADTRPASGLLARLDGGELAAREWRIDTRFDRFGYKRNADLLQHQRLTLLLHATVREILVAPDANEVVGLDVRGPGASKLRIQARAYVLAAGGLENPRLLLASNSVVPHGLGNAHDLVGRFFTEHPHGRGGRVVGGSAWALIDAFRKRRAGRQERAPLLTASADLQRRTGLLNSALTVAVRPPPAGDHSLVAAAYLAAKHRLSPTERGRAWWKAYKTVGRHLRHGSGPVYWWGRHLLGGDELVPVIRAEQAPNYHSRVTLADDVDATGMPRLKLDWRLSPQDRHSARELVAAFGRALDRLGAGRVEPAEWLFDEARNWVNDPLVSVHPIGGYHHMGTTRMSDSPRTGVTDGWGRVHGVHNLFVAGSSLFPTGGWANPTLTILALALRQADHLLTRLRS